MLRRESKKQGEGTGRVKGRRGLRLNKVVRDDGITEEVRPESRAERAASDPCRIWRRLGKEDQGCGVGITTALYSFHFLPWGSGTPTACSVEMRHVDVGAGAPVCRFREKVVRTCERTSQKTRILIKLLFLYLIC